MYEELLARLDCKIQTSLLELALTHSSFSYENGGESNERLEFLGDSILGFLVAQEVFERNAELDEGDLTRLKNSLVSADSLATAASRLDIGKYLRLGKGEEGSGGRTRLNILADAMEAVIAATFLSSGIDEAKKLVQEQILPMLGDPLALRELADPKTTLNERLRQTYRPEVTYKVDSSGPEHDKQYSALCFSGNDLLGEGQGRTIRSAESAAAAAALRNLTR
jgi:ribonuclease-3